MDVRSSILYFTSNWNNDWAIDTDVLFDEEKNEYFTNFNENNVNFLVKKINNLSPSIKNYYINEIKKIISGYQDRFFDQNQDNITFYIEYTNPNIKWTNTTESTSPVTEDEKKEIGSSYNLVKINNKLSATFAYTNKKTAKFELPAGFGSYVIKDKPVKAHMNVMNVSQSSSLKNYNFDFNLAHSATYGSDTASVFKASVGTSSTAQFTQVHEYTVDEGAFKKVITQEAYNGFLPGQSRSKLPNTSQAGLLKTSETNTILDIPNPLNTYSYTYDIDKGNTYSSYSLNDSGPYVRYIQLTLNAYGIKTTIDGKFGAKTAANVKQFQKDKKIIVDGIVDSQTKESLAFVWSGMNGDVKKDYIKKINNGDYTDKTFDKYINGASNALTVKNAIDQDKTIRLINFTSSSNGPERMVFYIGFKLPGSEDSNAKLIESVAIETGEFSSLAKAYNGMNLLSYQIGNGYRQGQVFPKLTKKHKSELLNLKLDSSDYVGKWITIKIEGDNLGGSFGSAEGLAIRSIYVNYKENDTDNSSPEVSYQEWVPKIVPKTRYKDVTATISYDVAFEKNSNQITIAEPKSITIDYPTIKNPGVKIKSIQLYKVSGNEFTDEAITYKDLNLDLDGSLYQPDPSRSEKVRLTPTKYNGLSTATLKSVNELDLGHTSSLDNVVLAKSVNTITASTNVLKYTKSFYKNLVKVTGYNLKTQSGSIIEGKNSVNYYDGLMLLCNDDGMPIGVDLASVYSISTAMPVNKDVYYSNITLTNTYGDQSGFEYGFYDIKDGKFIGKEITYLKYIQSGPQNIYIGIFAYDYDGDLATNKEFISSTNDSVYNPVQVPSKAAYPVYHVKSNAKNKIQLMDINPNLSKTEPWPIAISSGSFLRNIYVDLPQIGTAYLPSQDWIHNYFNQTLTAKYDTSNMNQTLWSEIFGRGYYDVWDEKPIYDSPYSIYLRKLPLHVIKSESVDPEHKGSPIKPVLNVFIRENLSSPWMPVDYSTQIKSFNSETGLIEFFNPIISSNEDLTLVSYTIKNSAVEVKQAYGNPIPINPFLNKDSVKINQPLYIYLNPKEIYKDYSFDTGKIKITQQRKVLVEEYTPGPIVNFTYNNNIFNKYDSTEYDPFALLIGIVYVVNLFDDDNFIYSDLRVKGGGVSANVDTNDIIKEIPDTVSYWDVYPPLGAAYPKGGYVMVKIPGSVKRNFNNIEQVYEIVKNNLTAGIVFDLLDMDGNDWGSSNDVIPS